MSLPKWIKHTLTDEGRERVRAAVQAAEKRSQGQIVPMVVRHSAGVRHVPYALAFMFLGIAYLAKLSLFNAWLPWGHSPALALLLDLALAGLLGWGLAKFAWIRRVFTPHPDRHRSAWMRAEMAFYRHGLDKTKGSTGVLLFISLEDRQAIVVADKRIAAKVPREVWNEVCEMLLRGARQGDLANGFQAAIQRCASVLEKHFPAKGKHPNELPDKLIIET